MRHAPPAKGNYDTLCGVDLDDSSVDHENTGRARKSLRERGEEVVRVGERVTCPQCIAVIDSVHESFFIAPLASRHTRRTKP